MVSLSSDEVESLKKVLEYVIDTEGDDYDNFLKEGGEEEHHVMYHAIMMQHILELKGELPDTRLTGDTSLDEF